MGVDEFAALDATAQAELVRRKEVTPRELVNAAIARIETLNPTLNAVISERFDAARTEADEASSDGPFPGVPFLLKDLACTMAGDSARSTSPAWASVVWPPRVAGIWQWKNSRRGGRGR